MRSFSVPIAKQEWLDDGLRHAIKVFQLALDGRIPDGLKGWMLHTACKRVLRSVHGSDLDTAVEIRRDVLKDEGQNIKGERTDNSTCPKPKH